MAVYTHIPHDDLCALLEQHYHLARIVSTHTIAEGIENSNYLIKTDTERYIFTIFEKRVAQEDIPFYLELTEHLSAHGFPCPTPIHTKQNALTFVHAGKTATLISFLKGEGVRKIEDFHLAPLGKAVAQFHHMSDRFTDSRPNHFALPFWRDTAHMLGEKLDSIAPNTYAMVQEELAFLSQHWPSHLPRGIVHTDIFPDNVFFLGEHLSGMIDFYFSCEDIRIYELAIVLNAWCFSETQEWQVHRAKDFLKFYHAHRALSGEEQQALPVVLRGAALRFFLTRSQDWLNPVQNALVTPKNPLEYLRKLTFHQQHQHDLKNLFG